MRSPALHVSLGSRSYPIHLDAGLLDEHELIAAQVHGAQAFVLSDANVAPLYLHKVLDALSDKTVQRLVIPAGEQEKTLARFSEVMDALAAQKASRDVTVMALGGGVIGDLGGFAAACWMRGVRFVQIPTTLLAMVDSSVGGKTAVDLPQGKNLVGAFHQPSAVLMDTRVLRSLPRRELSAGFAEVVKYGAIFDLGFIEWLEAHAEKLLALEDATLAECIRRCCEYKAGVVQRDETEQGERMLLNFGHTFGHAIETLQGYGGLLHGEAVSVGMCLAARHSTEQGMAPLEDAQRLQRLLQRFELPTELPEGISTEALWDAMRLDKKAVSGKIRLILLKRLGQAMAAA